MEVMHVDMGPVKLGLGSAINIVKDWSKWIGREVVLLAGKGFSLIQRAFLAVLDVAKSCWEVVTPVLNGIVTFLRSSAGVVSLTVTGGFLLGYTALKLTDSTARLTLLALSYVVFGFGLIYGCQTGVIPLLV